MEATVAVSEPFEIGIDNNLPPAAVQLSILEGFIKELACLMSGRAAVIKCFDAKMAAFKKEVLDEDTPSSTPSFLGLYIPAVDAANKFEEDTKATSGGLGRDYSAKFASFSTGESSTIRIIRMTAEIADPRRDEKNR
ncbi:hypothetical protein PoB_001748000 [Plakobranchus ocellatus]|uniref:Uncharacterized protein n=1 Tax=Plakobranchus ocellatus TaxID=259542 RepID=A0AAV3Z771_9GAST|nr:hypothetical protein PoB_001748000 [Plakobranchus ocellatus]